MCMLAGTLCLQAYDVRIDGIYYNLDHKNRTAEVTTIFSPWHDTAYSNLSVADIPSTITYRRRSYTVTGIGDLAFNGRQRLQKVTLPPTITYIACCAFCDCSNLSEITLPKSIRRIGLMAFSRCVSLPTIELPDSLEHIGQEAFADCTGLRFVRIPKALKKIETSCFSGCTGMDTLIISEGVEYIGFLAFSQCTGLSSVTIPGSIKHIGTKAFESAALTRVSIPKTVYSIDFNIFAGCTNLVSVDVEEGNPYLCSVDGVLYAKDTTILIAYPIGRPDTVVAIREGVTIISRNAFSDCTALQTIVLPRCLRSVREEAFSNCPNLTTVVCYPIKPPTCDKNAFDAYTIFPHLFVPDESVELYQSAAGWKDAFLCVPMQYLFNCFMPSM